MESQMATADANDRNGGFVANTIATSNGMTQTISNIRTQRLVVVLAVLSLLGSVTAIIVAVRG